MTPEAARYAEALVVASDDDGSRTRAERAGGPPCRVHPYPPLGYGAVPRFQRSIWQVTAEQLCVGLRRPDRHGDRDRDCYEDSRVRAGSMPGEDASCRPEPPRELRAVLHQEHLISPGQVCGLNPSSGATLSSKM